jgi:two-component system chemotaxis response regulator CheB
MRGPAGRCARRRLRADDATADAGSRAARPRQGKPHGGGAGPGSGKVENPALFLGTPRILAIGSSTGGPQALQEVMKEDRHGDERRAGGDHAAHAADLHGNPGGAHGQGCDASGEGRRGRRGAQARKHLCRAGRQAHDRRKRRRPAGCRLEDGPPVNFCKPAVDPLFDSVAKVYGSATLAIILTGMGHDGANGVRTISAGGGSIITQDEATASSGACREQRPTPACAATFCR